MLWGSKKEERFVEAERVVDALVAEGFTHDPRDVRAEELDGFRVRANERGWLTFEAAGERADEAGNALVRYLEFREVPHFAHGVVMGPESYLCYSVESWMVDPKGNVSSSW